MELKKRHSLIDLLNELISINKDFEIFQEAIRILDQYYISTRYASAFASGLQKDILQNFKLSKQ